MRLAMALGLRKSDFPMAATLTLGRPRPAPYPRRKWPPAPRKHFPPPPPGPAARMRGAGALTFSGAVVEAPPCSPEGPLSRFTSRNGNGRGRGPGGVLWGRGDASRWVEAGGGVALRGGRVAGADPGGLRGRRSPQPWGARGWWGRRPGQPMRCCGLRCGWRSGDREAEGKRPPWGAVVTCRGRRLRPLSRGSVGGGRGGDGSS